MQPVAPYTNPAYYTYSAVYYLAGEVWYQVAAGFNLDVAQLIYDAPTFPVFVWWWDGKSTWTPEMVYDRAVAPAVR